MESFTKTVRLGTGDCGSVYCKIEYTQQNGKSKLSISGVEGPTRSGNAIGSCGQIVMSGLNVTEYAPGWSQELIGKFADTWDRWHLNDMRAGCEHQRQSWNPEEKIEVVTYGLNHEGHRAREEALKEASRAAIAGEVANLTEAGKILIGNDWFRDLHEPQDADSPLSGLYDVKKRETKSAGWVYPHEHPKGLLTKACEVCGYKYGSEWLHEDVPEEVLEFLAGLPDTDQTPAWV